VNSARKENRRSSGRAARPGAAANRRRDCRPARIRSAADATAAQSTACSTRHRKAIAALREPECAGSFRGAGPRSARRTFKLDRSCRCARICSRRNGSRPGEAAGRCAAPARSRRSAPGRGGSRRPDRGTVRELRHAAAGTASIAQTHRARTREGDEVVVKVQRPGIRGHDALRPRPALPVAQILESSIDEMQIVGVVAIVEEFEKGLLKETELHQETVESARVPAQLEAGHPVTVPTRIPELSRARC